MNIGKIIQSRYSTKKFDASKVLSAEQVKTLKDLLRFSPSSVNSQPWHFFLASSASGKKQISKSTEGPHAYNTEKIMDASHVVVMCRKTNIDQAHLKDLITSEEKDGRYKDAKVKDYVEQVRAFYTQYHAEQLNDLDSWMAKQVYLSAGMFLMGVAALGIDAVPVEGFDSKILDEELKLKDKGLASVLLIPVGFRSADDNNAALPKSRLPESTVITEM